MKAEELGTHRGCQRPEGLPIPPYKTAEQIESLFSLPGWLPRSLVFSSSSFAALPLCALGTSVRLASALEQFLQLKAEETSVVKGKPLVEKYREEWACHMCLAFSCLSCMGECKETPSSMAAPRREWLTHRGKEKNRWQPAQNALGRGP